MSSEIAVALIALVASISSGLLVSWFTREKIKADTEKAKLETEIIKRQLEALKPAPNEKIIVEKKGLESYFYADEAGGNADGIVYQEATKIISKAESEVLVLWSPSRYNRSSENKRSDKWKNYREIYFSTLINKCREKPYFVYRRYLQLIPENFIQAKQAQDEIQKAWLLDTGTRHHCREMLKCHLKNAGLKYTKQVSNDTIVLVDGRYILIEVDIHDFEAKVGEMESVIVIDDAEGNMVKHFKSVFFNLAENSSQLVAGISDSD